MILIGIGIVVDGDGVDGVGGDVEGDTCADEAEAEDECEDADAEGDEPWGDRAGEGGDAFVEGGFHKIEVLAVALVAEENGAADEDDGCGDAEGSVCIFEGHVGSLCATGGWWGSGWRWFRNFSGFLRRSCEVAGESGE